MPAWGTRIPFDQYLAIDRVSAHSLMDFNKSPRLYKRKKDGLASRPKNGAMEFGTACHTFILEGAKVFREKYHVGGPINPKTNAPYGPLTNAFRDFVAEKKEQGITVITENDYDVILEMAEGVNANGAAAEILSSGVAEVSIQTNIHKTDVKQRLDWWSQDAECCLDLKTTRAIATFEEDFHRFQYAIQVGMYGLIMHEVRGDVPPFYVLASEKSEPYAAKLYLVSEETMWESMQHVQSLLWRLRTCAADDRWDYGTEVIGTL